jgi:hypothetical protein
MLYENATNLDPADMRRGSTVIGGFIVILFGYKSVQHGFNKTAAKSQLPPKDEDSEQK